MLKIKDGPLKTKLLIVSFIMAPLISGFLGLTIYESNIFVNFRLKNMSKGSYLFVLSKTFQDKIKILVVDKKGTVLEEKKNK